MALRSYWAWPLGLTEYGPEVLPSMALRSYRVHGPEVLPSLALRSYRVWPWGLTEYGPKVSLQGLEDGGLDLVLLLAEELLRGRVQQVRVLHDFHLKKGGGEGINHWSHNKISHRRRINAEEKAKVVAASSGTELIQFLAALCSYLKKRINIITAIWRN